LLEYDPLIKILSPCKLNNNITEQIRIRIIEIKLLGLVIELIEEKDTLPVIELNKEKTNKK
jgi:hypothetical protein